MQRSSPCRFLYPAIFIISFVGIAYQVSLMRIFAIVQWYHFAYMMISIAMLGFAAGGTLSSLFRPLIRNREAPLLRCSVFLLAVSLVACYASSQKIPFETYQLISQPVQWAYLLCLYLILAIPFFFVSVSILLGFLLDPARVGRVYGTNMVGSGFGALGVVAFMYYFKPEMIPSVLTVCAGAAYFLLMTDGLKRLIQGIFFLGILMGVLLILGQMPLRISEYKGLSFALRMPDAKVVAESQSPLSVITAVRATQIRETPGQVSFRYPWPKGELLPAQTGLFFDADSISVIHHFTGDFKPFDFLDYVTSALPYHLIQVDRALVIGAGGGTDVLMALSHGVKQVTAVELDPRVFSMIHDHFLDFSGGIYERPDVTPVISEGRQYLQSSVHHYDLIHIPPLDSFNASSAGVYALNESYLYTPEALALAIRRLTPHGLLTITRWAKSPPRDELKMFASLIEAAEKTGIQNTAQHLAFIRSWNTVTLLISQSPLTESQIQAIRHFSQERGFDPCYYPGVTAEETNRFTVLKESIYYESAQALLFGDREKFYKNYLFDIRPAADDRPYFFQYFKWASFIRLMRGMGVEWIPFVEWGYLVLMATLFQALIASLILILLPFLFMSRPSSPAITGENKGEGQSRPQIPIFFYFSGIGFAYMFIEITFIQKFMLFLSYPIYAVAVVLTSFLIFAGIGSTLADRIRRKRFLSLAIACFIIAILGLVYHLLLPMVFSHWSHWSDISKIAASILLLAPLALTMGMPFPWGMQMVSDHFPNQMAWAWGINGCASVLGATLATFLAIHFGFRAVFLQAIFLYCLAFGSLYRLKRLTLL